MLSQKRNASGGKQVCGVQIRYIHKVRISHNSSKHRADKSCYCGRKEQGSDLQRNSVTVEKRPEGKSIPVASGNSGIPSTLSGQ